MNFLYDSDGKKLRQLTKNGVTDSLREDYIDNKIYENGVLTKVLIPGGYLQISSDTMVSPSYYYFAKDHLGNIRQVLNSNGETLEKNDYYPFGLRHNISDYAIFGSNKYKYNGKEQNEFGTLITLDYGARMYDPALGRWSTVDPLAEDDPEYSLYGYCHNNPINNIDPDGRWVWAAVGAVLDYGFQVYDNYQSGKSGYDAWVGDVNFASVGLSAINPIGKLAAAKTLVVEVAKATIEYTPNEGRQLNTEAKDIGKAVVNSVVSVGAGKLKNASGNQALKQADKKVVEANNKVSTAERRLAKSPNSSNKASNLSNARSAAQQARNAQVRTKILNSTVGKVNEKAVQQTINTANNRAQKDIEKK